MWHRHKLFSLQSICLTTGIVLGAASLVTNGIYFGTGDNSKEELETQRKKISILEQTIQEHDRRLPSWDLFLSDAPQELANQGYKVAIFNVGPDNQPKTADDIARYAIRIDENGKMVGIEEITVVPTQYKTGKTESPIK